MTQLIFQKGLMLIKQIRQNSVIFVTIGIFQIKGICYFKNSLCRLLLYYHRN